MTKKRKKESGEKDYKVNAHTILQNGVQCTQYQRKDSGIEKISFKKVQRTYSKKYKTKRIIEVIKNEFNIEQTIIRVLRHHQNQSHKKRG